MTSVVRQSGFFDPGSSSASATSFTASLLAATLAGSTLAVIGTMSASGSQTVTGISDATNGAYTLLTGAKDTSGAQYLRSAYKANAAAVTAGTLFTVTYSVTSTFRAMWIAEIANVQPASLANSSILDQTSVAIGTNNLGATAVPMGALPIMLLGLSMNTTGATATQPGIGTGFQSLGTGWGWGATATCSAEYANVQAPGTINAKFSALSLDNYVSISMGFLDQYQPPGPRPRTIFVMP